MKLPNKLWILKDGIKPIKHAGPNKDHNFDVLPFVLDYPGVIPPTDDQIVRQQDISPSYVRILLGMDWLVTNGIDVLSISLGPSNTLFDENDPLQVATRNIVNSKIPVVVAAGNSVGKGPAGRIMQPLAQAPWVISVGATDENQNLLATSNIGITGQCQPTVVSLGVTRHIPGVQDFEPGTSFAAPKVSRAVAFTKKALELFIRYFGDAISKKWDVLPKPIKLPVIGFLDTGIDPDHIPPLPVPLFPGDNVIFIPRGDREKNWYIEINSMLAQNNIAINLDASPSTIKRALSLMAKPLPKHSPTEVGYGFVGDAEVLDYLSNFTASRFIELFAPENKDISNKPSFQELDKRLGPIWNQETMEILETYFLKSITFSVARVM